ncbi:SusF/SusE family outer membrane protein [Bacteroides sp. 214]|uniref:SusF/SusE family outer membrane protein n=1 Tax=Bacteroides sp. 214 TaxID=2302935 RepID=UPI0013D0313F|nr:SusF/SusE family outer membrane protein [Bacteroides sp. 214]
MKKIHIIMSMVLCLVFITACESDNDSNPTLTDPTEFVLNVPAYASTVYDLKHSKTIELTCTQPNYGFPLAVNYSVQISLTGEFNEASGDDVAATYKTLATMYNSARMDVHALEIATAIVELSGAEDEEDFNAAYADPVKVYVRLNAALTNGMKPILSNIIELPHVQAYYALSPLEMPTDMYIIGSINGWNWNNAYDMVPVYGTQGKFWRVVYLDADAEIKFNSAQDWDGGDFGYANTIFPDKTYAGIEDKDGNIKITNGGWYIVVVTVTEQARKFVYTVDFFEPNVYLCGTASGGTWGVGTTNIFTVPATGDGEFVSPAFTGAPSGDNDDGIRACVVLEGHEWWHTEFMVFDGVIEYRGTGGDQDRVAGSIGEHLYFNFTAGTGSIK